MDDIMAVRRNPNATYEQVRALYTAAINMFKEQYGPKISIWPRSALGPLGGLLDGMYQHDEYYGLAPLRALIANRIVVWSILGLIKKRPGHNDFLLVRWALNGDEKTALELITRSKRKDSIGCTLCWALRSLCLQYPEFRERFDGLIPRANPDHMLKDAPKDQDPEAVLARSRELDLRHQGGARS